MVTGVNMKGGMFFSSSIDVLTKVTRWFAFAAAACLGIAMAIGVIDVIGTKFFSWPLVATKEVTEELNVGLVFLAIAFVAMERGHLRINLLELHMSARLRFAFRILSYVVTIPILGILSWRSFLQFKIQLVEKTYKFGQICIPVWPGGLVVFLGFIFFLTAAMLLLGKELTGNMKKGERVK
jgi:TRAP-type C4-dicarboxylate transport system permease small subunit